MQKTFCDCCRTEITEINHARAMPLHLPNHLLNGKESSHVKIIGDVMHPISGQTKLDLCIGCYNKITEAAAKKLHELKNFLNYK